MNSSLVDITIYSPNHSGKRTSKIDRITPHCVVGQVTAERLGQIFSPVSKQASSNYGIDKDGRVGLYVDECNRSWCSSSSANDQRAVTIECASATIKPYVMNEAVWNKLVLLCFDICDRNGKDTLLWIADKDKALKYEPSNNEMLITVHRWFKNKSCPGDWLYNRLGELADLVTVMLQEKRQKHEQKENKYYGLLVGRYRSEANVTRKCDEMVLKGHKPYIIKSKVDTGVFVTVCEKRSDSEKAQAHLSRLGVRGVITLLNKGGEVKWYEAKKNC